MFIIETKLPESGPDCIAKLRQDPRGGFQAGQRQCTEIFQDQLSGPSDLSGDTRKHRLYLQQAREFAVSKIDKLGPAPLFLAQSVDAVAQSQQRAVDVGSFLHPLALVLSLLGDRTDRQSTQFRMGVSAPGEDVQHHWGQGLDGKAMPPAKST